MRIRVWTWVLLLGLATPMIGGCPGDGEGEAMGGGTGGDPGDGAAGTLGGGAGVSGSPSHGDGDGDGDGPAGAGGTSGTGGGSSDLPPEAILAGACGMMDGSGADQLPECADIDGYTSCVGGCGYQTCINGACSDLLNCVENAPDQCNHGCEPSAECENCFATVDTDCAYACVMTHLLCSDDGGACDEAEACCSSLPADMQSTCMQTVAAGQMAAGDLGCQSVVDVYCPPSG
jgi:hypothetical protein